MVSLLFGLFANVVRGLRWGLLISSLGERFKMSNIIYAVLGNYAVNMVLPRVGEVWRCGIITKYDKIPFTKLLGTLLIDRVSDTIVVGLITLLIFIFNFDFFVSFFAKNPALLEGFQKMFDSIWIYVGAVILVVGIWSDQRSDHHEMPGTYSRLYRDGNPDATHGKSNQSDRYSQITGKVECIERYIEITEIATPYHQCLCHETSFLPPRRCFRIDTICIK